MSYPPSKICCNEYPPTSNNSEAVYPEFLSWNAENCGPSVPPVFLFNWFAVYLPSVLRVSE